ncbi:MAG: flavin reductase family protein [Pseudomonadota bacterium]
MDEKEFKSALSAFATGVAVVTANGQDGPVGITINSFASLSLDPPLVLWSIDKASRRCQAYCDAQFSAIHFLAADQRDTAKNFTKTGVELNDAAVNAQKVPIVENCLTRLDCESHAVLEGGDHFILISRVLNAEVGQGTPLLFYKAAFKELGA